MSRVAALALLLAGACTPPILREGHESTGLDFGVLVWEDIEFAGSVPGVNDEDGIRVSGAGLGMEHYLTPAWSFGGSFDYRAYQPRDREFSEAEALEFSLRLRRSFWTDRKLQPFIGVRLFSAIEWHFDDGGDSDPYLGIAPAVGFVYFEDQHASFEFAVAWVRTLRAPVIDDLLPGGEEIELEFEGVELTWWVSYWF